MKTRSLFLTLWLAVVVFVSGCSGDTKQNTAESHEGHLNEHASAPDETPVSKPQFEVDDKFQDQLATVFSAYLRLKEALVAGDAEKVRQEAAKAKDALANVDMKLLTGAAHNDWMNYTSPMENALTEIQASSDLEAQRKSFSALSDNLYKSAKAFGLGDQEAFYAFCPMAFNDEGAYWLSDTKNIRNPYFGDKMLTCGQVKEKLM